MSSETHPFHTILWQELAVIDELFGEAGVELQQRPLLAALDFVKYCMVAIRDEKGERKPQVPQVLTERWFALLVEDVETWYRKRYGDSLDRRPRRTATGLVVIWGTAFAVDVPLSATRPGNPGETVWLSFPAAVRDGEDPLSWLRSPPNLKVLRPEELDELRDVASEVAELLRSVNVSLLGITKGGAQSTALLHRVRSHLESAVRHATDSPSDTALGCWDLQMACECSMKATLDTLAGDFPKTHNLFRLHRQTTGFSESLPREWLSALPSSKRMIDFRYGIGRRPSVSAFFDYYKNALRIVHGAIGPIVAFGLKDAELEISRPPWIRRD